MQSGITSRRAVCLEHSLGTCNFRYFQAGERPRSKSHRPRVRTVHAAQLDQGPQLLAGRLSKGKVLIGSL